MADEGKLGAESASKWPDYRAVWRWHFYAGLFSIPFVIVLSISGAIYLFKPQVEAWVDRDCDQLTLSGARASIAAQVRAAMETHPETIPSGYELPRTAEASGRVLLWQNGKTLRVAVHPESLAVLKTQREDERFMRWLFRLHGELLMGNRGSNLVELASSWTIVMIVTGIYLWWPRHAKGWAGVLYPRLRHGKGLLYRDLHSVIGMWVSFFALFLLATGLPWAKFWGSYFKWGRQVTGTAVAQQDWTTGSDESPGGAAGAGRRGGASKGTDRGGHEGHGASSEGPAAGGAAAKSTGGGRRRGKPTMPEDLGAFDRIAATVGPLGLEYPVVIGTPAKRDGLWTAKSMTQNRTHRVNLELDGTTGQIVEREDFADRHWVDRVVGFGIAAHEGQLFGWANQALGAFTALGLVLISVTGVVMWWRRRDAGVLGAPRVLAAPRLAWGLLLLILLMAVYLPLFGASLVVVLAAERLVLSRVPRVRVWLGLRGATAVMVAAAFLATSVGCGGPRPTEGGAAGRLHSRGAGLSEIQVTVHRAEGGGFAPLAIAVPQPDGAFRLVTPDGKGPVELTPGEYRCTLESIGAPVFIPPELTKPETTPLKVNWLASDSLLDLDVPPLKPTR
ncbi:MAG: PepSY domain-containing protein [Pirellulales bacterium]